MMNREASIDWSKYNLGMKAFENCDNDENGALSWAEVSDCEVSFSEFR